MPEAWCCLCCWDVSVRCRKKIGNISSYQKKVRKPLVVSENILKLNSTTIFVFKCIENENVVPTELLSDTVFVRVAIRN